MRFDSFLPNLPRPLLGALCGGVAAIGVFIATWLLLGGGGGQTGNGQIGDGSPKPGAVVTADRPGTQGASDSASRTSAASGSAESGSTSTSGMNADGETTAGGSTGAAGKAAGKAPAAGKAESGGEVAAEGTASSPSKPGSPAADQPLPNASGSSQSGNSDAAIGSTDNQQTSISPQRAVGQRRLEPIRPVSSLTLIQAAIWWCLVLWLLAVGGCFGSFMNVVIYRLPAGLSLMRPASRCPYCLEGIRGTDNVPVLSWLWLRGQCRACGGAISPRYPLIEALIAFGCVALALVEVFPEGQGLPQEVQQDLRENPWQLWTMFAGHLLLLCTLVCAAAIQIDGHPVPLRLFIPLAVTAVVLATMVPEACRLRWSVGSSGTLSGNLIQAMMAAGCGAFAGASLALATREADRVGRGTLTMSIVVALVTLFLGWITGIVIAIGSGLLVAVRDRLSRRHPRLDEVPTVALVAAVTFGLLLAWRWLLPHFPLLALDSASSFAVATIVAALLLSAAAWWLGPWSPLNWPERGDTIEIVEGQFRRTEYRRRRHPAGGDADDRDDIRNDIRDDIRDDQPADDRARDRGRDGARDRDGGRDRDRDRDGARDRDGTRVQDRDDDFQGGTPDSRERRRG